MENSLRSTGHGNPQKNPVAPTSSTQFTLIFFGLFIEDTACLIEEQSSYIEHGICIPVFDQKEELPLLTFENPIGFVPASRGGVYIESTPIRN